MKYAVKYNRTFRYFNEVDEVVFDYKGTDKIVDFIPTLLNENQRAIINISTIEKIEDIIPFLNMLKLKHNNFIVQIDFFNQRNIIPLLKDNDIKFMFANYARTKEEFYSMIILEVVDVYVVEELAFDLKRIQDMRTKYNVNIRLIPDIGQSTKGTSKLLPQVTKFWIRPEDIELYGEYADVVEICRNDERESTIFKVYKQKQWLGQLEDIIMDVDFYINNTAVNPHFGTWRINCHKDCMFEKCNLCMEVEELAKRFEAVGITVKKKRDLGDMPQEEKDKIIEDLKERGKEIVNNESEVDETTLRTEEGATGEDSP